MLSSLRKLFRSAFYPLFDLLPLPDRLAIQILYFLHFRRFADLKNPKTFYEKVNWRKLYQRDPRFPVFADKIAVKAEIEKLIGKEHVIPTLWTGDRPEDIPYDRLDPPYVIKVNHSSDDNIFIRKKEDVDREAINKSINRQLRYEHGHRYREWAYLGIPHKVLVERMIEVPDSASLNDYKFFVFHGKARFVQVIFDRFSKQKKNYYDMNWQRLPIKTKSPNFEGNAPRPKHFDKMIELAEKIGAPFDFVRVDLYETEETVLFGEVTFYPAAGYGCLSPDIWDERFGHYWNLKT